MGGEEKRGEGREDLAAIPSLVRLESHLSALLSTAWLCDSASSGLCGKAGSCPMPAVLSCCLSLALSRSPARAVAEWGSWDSVLGCSHVGPQSQSKIHQTGLRSTCSIAPNVSSTGMFYQVFKRISSPNYYLYIPDWKTEAQRSCPGSQS